jgi:hypothetical protein
MAQDVYCLIVDRHCRDRYEQDPFGAHDARPLICYLGGQSVTGD